MKKTKALSFSLSNLECSLVDGLALSRSISSRNAEYFACLYVFVCVRKYHSQLKEYHELCYVFSLSRARVLALNCTISHQMLQGFIDSFYLKATYTECCNVSFCIIINMSLNFEYLGPHKSVLQ